MGRRVARDLLGDRAQTAAATQERQPQQAHADDEQRATADAERATISSGPRRADSLVAVAEIASGNIAIESIIPREMIDRTIASRPMRMPPSLRRTPTLTM